MDFVTQFYNIQGDLISERKRNFSKLLKAQTVPLTEEDLKSLHPRTPLEGLFHIDILIHFKILKKLLDVIKGGNEVYISKIMKHPLLVKETIGYVSAESFVNEFLPCVSRAMRMKVVKKVTLYLDEAEIDEIVSCMYKRYGLAEAVKILHLCSSNQIREFLSSHEIILRPRQVKYIFDKDPELLSFYLEHHKTLKGSVYNHKKLYWYIAAKNIKFWERLKEKNLIRVQRLGRKTSKKFINVNSKDILDNVRSYSDFLPVEVIVRKLHGNFQNVYLKFFPKDINELYRSDFCHTLLKYYPKNKQWEMFAQTFAKVHKSDIMDNMAHLSSSFLDLLPNKSIKYKWWQVQYDRDKSTRTLTHCDPDMALPLIKEKINVTSDIDERVDLVNLLVENCVESKDWAALEGILKYISIRHRNKDTLQKILYTIKDVDFEALNKNHWTNIIEIITFLRLRKLLHSTNLINYLILKYIEYLILHGEPYLKELEMYVEYAYTDFGNFPIRIDNPEIKKQILIDIIKIYRTVIPRDKKVNIFADRYEVDLINEVIYFNINHPECTVDIDKFPEIMVRIASILEKCVKNSSTTERNILFTLITRNLQHPDQPIVALDNTKILEILRRNKTDINSVSSVLIQKVTKHTRSKFENEILELLWDCLDNPYLSKRVLCWFFTKEPRTLLPLFDKLLLQHKSYIDPAYIKYMSHLGFDKKVKDYSLEQLKVAEKFLNEIYTRTEPDAATKSKQKLNIDTWIIDALSVILSTSEYVEEVERFLPNRKYIIANPEELHEIYALQCAIARSLKKMSQPVLALDTVIKFSVGDYLQVTLPTLYSVCYRSPEKNLPLHMETLSKGAISVRKHAVFLSCELLDCDSIQVSLHKANRSHVTSEKYIFSATFKYFCKNATEELLNLVADSLKTIDKNDQETLENLVDTKVPKKYVPPFIEIRWYFLEDMRKKGVKVNRYLSSLLNGIVGRQDVFACFPEAFCKHIISCYFSAHTTDLNGIQRFVCMVLEYRPTEQNFKLVFDLISAAKAETKLKFIRDFFENWYDASMKDVMISKSICHSVELFKQHWYQLFTHIEMFDQHLLLDLLYLESRTTNDENYAQELLLYLEKLVAEYGFLVYYKFKDVLPRSSFISKVKYLLFHHILKYKISTLSCILVLDLMRSQQSADVEKALFDEIKEMLKGANDPLVRVYYNDWFCKDQ